MFAPQVQGTTTAPPTLAGRVFGLLAFAMVLTAAGALAVPYLGASAGAIGGTGALLAFLLLLFSGRFPPVLRLGVFYLYSVFQGVGLGVVINNYVTAGRGNVVALAAGTTASLVSALAVYAWTTKRNLNGLGSYLFIGLIGVLLAGIVGIFVTAPLYHVIASAATAIVFSGYLLWHVQHLKDPSGDAIGLAVGIYIAMLNIFYSLLRILDEANRRR